MFLKLILILVFIEVIDGCDFNLHKRNSKFRSRRPLPGYFKAKLESNGVVPDVIDSVPTHKIDVRYPIGLEVNFGNVLTPFSVKDEPRVDWPVEEGQNYTLIMTDPDVPNRKERTGQVKHWLVMNIPGTDLSKGQTLASYRGSAPPEGSGLHRYIFLVYKQTNYIEHTETHPIPIEPENRKDRINFNVREFAKKYDLDQPIASNFYQAQSDQYTRDLWAKWNALAKLNEK